MAIRSQLVALPHKDPVDRFLAAIGPDFFIGLDYN